jgi:signal transduction histidine kinase
MTTATSLPSVAEADLATIISSYNEVTERLRASHEQLTREVSLLRDQLEEKNRELARKERLAALGEMAAGVAHEIRNPLAGIQLFASLLERDLADRPKAQELAAKISNGVGTLDGIVSDILAFAGRREVPLEPLRLAAEVAETLELVAPRRSALQATVHVDLEECNCVVQANPIQLQRALLNLLFNALDAAGEGGEVWLDCREDDSAGYVHLSVGDNGPGVPAELAQKIFDPFFTAKETGTGLGLAIVHRIAESHGGSVRLSRREGGGAVFTLSLRSAAGAGGTTPIQGG